MSYRVEPIIVSSLVKSFTLLVITEFERSFATLVRALSSITMSLQTCNGRHEFGIDKRFNSFFPFFARVLSDLALSVGPSIGHV